MGWLVKQYPDGKFGLWSTITDSYIVRKCSREYMIRAIEKMWIHDLAEKVKELNRTFPENWSDKDNGQIRKRR